MSTYCLPEGYTSFQTFLNTFRLVKDPLPVLGEGCQQFGPTFSFSVPFRHHIIVTQDPGFIDHVLKKNHKNYVKSPNISDRLGHYLGDGLLTANGEHWLRQRRLIQPGFHKERLQGLYHTVLKVIDEFLKDFPTGEAVDVYPHLNQLAFKIAIRSLFDIKLADDTMAELSRFVTEVQAFVVKTIRQPYLNGWRQLTGQVRASLAKTEKARALIRDIIRTRKAGTERYHDLLDMLLDVRYEDTGLPMDEEQMVEEIMILVVAGHETTANALSWILHLLARHPQELARLKEATRGDDVLACTQNPYLAAVIKEGMRLYPPAWILDRMAVADDEFEGYTFPAGTVVIPFLYGLHHDATWWQEPELFNPTRFIEEKYDKVQAPAYYPFGGGPRFCIGNHFAMAEMALFLQQFIQRFTLKPTLHVPVPLALITLRPNGVVLNVTKAS